MAKSKRRRGSKAARLNPPARHIIQTSEQLGQLPHSVSAAAADLSVVAIGPHLFPEVWTPLDWIAPIQDGQLCLQVHRTAINEVYGPILFCCLKAYDLHKHRFPEMGMSKTVWQLINMETLYPWLAQELPVMFFCFCDPAEPEGLYTLGLGQPHLADVLAKRRPIEAFIPIADKLL